MNRSSPRRMKTPFRPYTRHFVRYFHSRINDGPKTFINKTHLDIVEGVKEAQAKTLELGGGANPTMKDLSENVNLKYVGSRGDSGDQRIIFPVEFDIALSTEDSSRVEGGAGVSIPILKVGVRSDANHQMHKMHK
jgi:hypothetical protein